MQFIEESFYSEMIQVLVRSFVLQRLNITDRFKYSENTVRPPNTSYQSHVLDVSL